jgi:hypothetical protein
MGQKKVRLANLEAGKNIDTVTVVRPNNEIEAVGKGGFELRFFARGGLRASFSTLDLDRECPLLDAPEVGGLLVQKYLLYSYKSTCLHPK